MSRLSPYHLIQKSRRIPARRSEDPGGEGGSEDPSDRRIPAEKVVAKTQLIRKTLPTQKTTAVKAEMMKRLRR